MCDLPHDLSKFLRRGSQLDFEPGGTQIGPIRLKLLEDLVLTTLRVFPGCQSIIDDPYELLDGMYYIEAYDLIASSERYESEGLFCWIPKLSQFATVDPEHSDIVGFPDVSWSTIVDDPVTYLDAQWGLSDEGNHVYPWLHFSFKFNDGVGELAPYPEVCPLHARPIVPRAFHRHSLFNVYRRRDVGRWFVASQEQFPFAGVPFSNTELLSCEDCVDGELKWVHKIDSTMPLLDAAANAGGFVQCPGCGIRFSPNDAAVFVNRVHLTCGQKINVLRRDART